MKVMHLGLLCVTFGLFEYLTCKYRQEKREISQNRVMLCETMIHSLFLNCNFILPTSNKQRQTPPTFCRLLGDFPATEQSAEDLFYQWLKSKNISSGNFLPKKKTPRNRWSPHPRVSRSGLARHPSPHLPQCRLIFAALSTPRISLTTDLVATATQWGGRPSVNRGPETLGGEGAQLPPPPLSLPPLPPLPLSPPCTPRPLPGPISSP